MDIYNNNTQKSPKRILHAFILGKSAPLKGVKNIQFAFAPSLMGTRLPALCQSIAKCSFSLTVYLYVPELFLVLCV